MLAVVGDGDAQRFADLARQMIELTGQVPDVDIKIEFTGLKPGEKLSEALYDTNEIVLECADGIMEVQPATANLTTPSSIAALVKQAREDAPDTVAASVNRLLAAGRQQLDHSSSLEAHVPVEHTA